MGYLQASVPLGGKFLSVLQSIANLTSILLVMGGYIIASIIVGISRDSLTLLYINCWRWPLFIGQLTLNVHQMHNYLQVVLNARSTVTTPLLRGLQLCT